MHSDGWSLDDKRQPLLEDSKLGVSPVAQLNAEEHAKNNLPDLITRWLQRDGTEQINERTAQSFNS